MCAYTECNVHLPMVHLFPVLSPQTLCSQEYFSRSYYDQTRNVPGVIFSANYVAYSVSNR